MQCTILAGGLGTRMLPRTENVPKTLLPVLGRPFADYQLRWLRSQGVTSVVYCIGHLGSMIQDYVRDGSGWDLAVTYSDEGESLLGTAGALRLAYDKGLLWDRTFVLYGDSWLTLDLPEVDCAFTQSGLPTLMTVLRNEGRWEVSNVEFRDGALLHYDKRPGPHRDRMAYVDYGLLAWSRDAVSRYLSPGVRTDLADVLRSLSSEGLLAGFEVHERFYEVGSPSGLEDFESFLSGSAGTDRTHPVQITPGVTPNAQLFTNLSR
jgi:NDP-sugar pyrophosphorylase family protein